ncbi:FAD-dependent oxidoreductase [Streptomyces sp. NPDC091371]|uniref:FAD-dependent oxidoreductase n=1 Tax=Streptomyces sp. NPDC091371 TaxID=3155303 RepID=UPI00341AB503
MSRPTVAVIGAGVSGMTAAYLLQRTHDVTVFEANDYLGGNANTQDAVLSADVTIPVDVAFMAYDETYPNIKRLFGELEVASRPANIAIDVVCTGCGFTHMGSTPFGDGVVAARPDGVDPEVWGRFTAELERFPADLVAAVESGETTTMSVGEFLAKKDYSDYFFQHFVYPRVGPWWLNGPGSVHAMSLEFLLSTMRKYGLLNPDAFSTWRVVAGGSRAYLDKIAARLTAVHTSSRVREVRRTADGVLVRDAAGRTHAFDKAVVAVHPPTALEILYHATARERELLGIFRYMPMDATLHTDLSVFPETGVPHSGFSMTVSCTDRNDPRDAERLAGAMICSDVRDMQAGAIRSTTAGQAVAGRGALAVGQAVKRQPPSGPDFNSTGSLSDSTGGGCQFGSGYHEVAAAAAARRDMRVTHDQFLDSVREYAAQELIARRDPADKQGSLPTPAQRAFHTRGLANWWLPEAYGGRGVSLADSVDVVSELSYGDAGSAFTLFISVLGSTMVSLYGTEELKERTLGKAGAAGGFSATLGSERAAGSELTHITTRAARRGDHLVLDGEKMFATNADFAEFLVVVAVSAENPLEHLAVVVPRDTPGVRIDRRWETLGLGSAGTYQVSFENCRVPASNALRGPGLLLLEVGLNTSRTLIAATGVGIARRIRDLCMEYARTKRLRGERLLDSPVFAAKLGQMEMWIEVMRNQCLAAAAEFDALAALPDGPDELLGRGALRSAVAAKMFCGQTGWRIASTGSEMFGGLGYTDDSPIGGLLRDMRYISLVEGGDDVLRELLYRRCVVPARRRL